MSTYLPGRSYLINRPIEPALLQELGVEMIDLLEAELSSLTLKEVRSLVARASSKPFGAHRLLWLHGADTADEPTQNTLLKLLEEPPSTLYIFVEASLADRFLPTVRSRLHRLGNSVAASEAPAASAYSDLGAFESALRSTDRAGVEALISKELARCSWQFRQTPSPEGSKAIQLLELSLLRLRQSANAKLVIDWLVLRYPLLSGRA